MIRLFAGYEQREALGLAVFVDSVLAQASQPVAITPLDARGLGRGSNAFTVSRFLVPSLCGFEGHAIFADGSDMLMLADIAELDALFDSRYAVQVVQHPDYQTRHPRKYVGTPLECENHDYSRKNWASLMLINCAHPAWRGAAELKVSHPLACLQFDDFAHADIGALPPAWNVLADEGQPLDGAKLLHFTAGIPSFYHYRNSPGAEHWHRARARMEGA